MVISVNDTLAGLIKPHVFSYRLAQQIESNLLGGWFVACLLALLSCLLASLHSKLFDQGALTAIALLLDYLLTWFLICFI